MGTGSNDDTDEQIVMVVESPKPPTQKCAGAGLSKCQLFTVAFVRRCRRSSKYPIAAPAMTMPTKRPSRPKNALSPAPPISAASSSSMPQTTPIAVAQNFLSFFMISSFCV